MGLFATLSITVLNAIMLSVAIFYSYVECSYAECRYAKGGSALILP
jgi:hypothetical protein